VATAEIDRGVAVYLFQRCKVSSLFEKNDEIPDEGVGEVSSARNEHYYQCGDDSERHGDLLGG
jgi:hypothetical protein